MIPNIYHYCNTTEVSTVATNILIALSKNDWSSDVALSTMIKILGEENEIFTKSFHSSRSASHSKVIHEKDELVDKLYICTKQFIWANTYVPEKDIAEKADRIWQIFDAHNLNLHRQSYENQMALTKSLIENINHVEVRRDLEKLTGVARRFDAFAKASIDFRDSFVENKESAADMEEFTPPSTQKNVVRKIINEQLTAYLDGVAVAIPDKYEEINKIISEHIESINTKARARKTRNTAEEPEAIIAE